MPPKRRTFPGDLRTAEGTRSFIASLRSLTVSELEDDLSWIAAKSKLERVSEEQRFAGYRAIFEAIGLAGSLVHARLTDIFAIAQSDKAAKKAAGTAIVQALFGEFRVVEKRRRPKEEKIRTSLFTMSVAWGEDVAARYKKLSQPTLEHMAAISNSAPHNDRIRKGTAGNLPRGNGISNGDAKLAKRRITEAGGNAYENDAIPVPSLNDELLKTHDLRMSQADEEQDNEEAEQGDHKAQNEDEQNDENEEQQNEEQQNQDQQNEDQQDEDQKDENGDSQDEEEQQQGDEEQKDAEESKEDEERQQNDEEHQDEQPLVPHRNLRAKGHQKRRMRSAMSFGSSSSNSCDRSWAMMHSWQEKWSWARTKGWSTTWSRRKGSPMTVQSRPPAAEGLSPPSSSIAVGGFASFGSGLIGALENATNREHSAPVCRRACEWDDNKEHP
ncbi:hypothetical protein IWX90DRAFT_413801 [Phyllosticta citrichinensis]|uniref:Uncharacterized protein n=1 Tax=Phyllosticta citrichinensis TaxID=1130410 RepID=A0ABR1XVD4_9PEZI